MHIREEYDMELNHVQVGYQRVDFVLVFKESDKNSENYDREKRRTVFESNLREEGLQLDYCQDNKKLGFTFVKIFAPCDVLMKYAEVMRIKMPMKAMELNMKKLFDDGDKDEEMIFMAPYSRHKNYLFELPSDMNLLFTPAQRALIVEYILKRKSFSSNTNDVSSIGINKLISDDVYLAAYPLHDGKLSDCKESQRRRLQNKWGRIWKIFRSQPLDEIREYFGVKIALYFAWLGFYTKMLIPASIVGIICFVYGVVTMFDDIPTKQVCSTEFDEIPMCPHCSPNCNFTRLSDSCTHMRISYLFVNPGTVLFAIFMSIWATIYLELWKRYSARIAFKWDLTDFDSCGEIPRPEYLAHLAQSDHKKVNPITGMYEPHFSFIKLKLPHLMISSFVVILFVFLSLAFVISIIVYRVSVQTAIFMRSSSPIIQENSSIITSLTAACINLTCILILNQIYWRIALYLTEKEMPRTQSQFDNSLTIKIYLFQFVNFYSSIFYIAFFKGRFIETPSDLEERSIFKEACPTGGCLLDLVIQLAIIMVGKQILNAIIEMGTPIIKLLYQKRKYNAHIEELSESNLPQWEDDYVLSGWSPTSLFYEYLEMVIQFGFVTIFVSAFPLAPLFALINNVFEIRLDAVKIITTFRRPVAQRVKDIGIWYRILDSVGKLSVITNGAIIAFTSDFVPKIFYYFENGNFDGYLNSTLSYYNATSLEQKSDFEICVYEDYREAQEPYQRTEYYWHVMVMRLAFIVIFENVIISLTSMLRVMIPDVPKKLRNKKLQHDFLTNELIMKHERKSVIN